MTDENENTRENEGQEDEAQQPNESTDSTDTGSNVEDEIAQIADYGHRLDLVRRGLFAGILAVMAIGIGGLYFSAKKSAYDPLKEKYLEANATYADIETRVNDAYKTVNRLEPKAKKAYSIFRAEYSRLEPKTSQAYKAIRDMADSDSQANHDLRNALQVKLDTKIKPAARDISQKALFDLQDDALEQFKELASQSEVIMFSARQEYYKLTNSLPDQITQVIEQTLIETINEREDKMREMFPKLTKEKQAEVVSRLSNFSNEQAEKIFIALFTDHLSELGKLQDALDTIYDKEGDAAEFKTNVESTIALLSALLEVTMSEFDSQGKKKGVSPKEPKPEPKPGSTPQDSSDNK